MRIAALALAALGLSLGGVPASATGPVVNGIEATTFNASTIGYAEPVVVIQEGGTLTLHNTDLLPHTVTARDKGADDQPLFGGGAGFLQSADVAGVSALAPGQYPFYCTIHPEMQGTLIVAAIPPTV